MRSAIWQDRRGATAVTFGILAVPVIFGVGLCVDYATMSRDKALVQGITDRALLAAALLPKAKEKQIRTAAVSYINAEKGSSLFGVIDEVTVSFPAADRIRILVQAHTPTTLMNLVADRFSFVVTSEAQYGLADELEVAIALDTTDSMSSNGKLGAAKTAAKALVDSLTGDEADTVKVSLVPFASHVSVGTGNSTATWLDIQEENARNCRSTNPPTTCGFFPGWKDGFWSRNGSWQCEYPPGTRNICETKPAVWEGCVGSRNAPLDVEAGGDASAKIPGVMNVNCSRTLVPLTADATTIKSEIDALTAGGETYLPAGILWGFNMLTPGAPMSTAAPFDPDGSNKHPIKVLVVMTDGKNSKFAIGAKHVGDAVTNATVPNEKTKAVCDNVKAKQIAVYTISFTVADDVTKTLLQECATDPSYYYEAGNSAALIDAFKDIARSLKKIRLSR